MQEKPSEIQFMGFRRPDSGVTPIPKGRKNMPNKQTKVDIYGLTEAQIQTLKTIALQKTSNVSLSAFARGLLLAQLPATEVEPVSKAETNKTAADKMRLELKLPAYMADYLHTAAEQGKMSLNRIALYILAQHIEQRPILTDSEVTALYQSNVQISAIGRNLNQIARHLNSGEGASLSQKHIADITHIIDEHIKKVGKIIAKQRQRQNN